MKAATAILALTIVSAACGDDGDGESAEPAPTDGATAAPDTDDGAAGTGDDGTIAPTASAGTTGATGAGEGCTEERMGGSLTFGGFTEPAGLDPILASGSGGVGGIELTNLFDTLVRFDVETGEYEPYLAESLESNEDFSEWTVTLRDGITFTDGEPLDAEVVKASVERHFSDANVTTSRGHVASAIDEITVVDPLTVQFTLIDPWRNFPILLAYRPGMITNPTAVEEAGGAFADEVPPAAGVGPYELVRYVPGEEIVMQAKDDYWGGPVCIEELTFTVVPGGSATYEAFRNGDLQAFVIVDDPPATAEIRGDGVEGHADRTSMDLMILNNGFGDSERPTADVRVRQAVAAALDPEVLNERAFGGAAIGAETILDEDTSRDVELSGPEFDPEQAAELVEEVKAETGWDGTIEQLCTPVPASQERCLATKAMLDAVGFDTELVNLASSSDSIQRIIIDHDFDIARWAMPYPEVAPWFSLKQFGTGSSGNRPGYSNPEMDAALQELKTAGSVEEENEILEQIQEIWNETVPGVKYATGEMYLGWAEHVEGIVPIGNGMASFADAYLTE